MGTRSFRAAVIKKIRDICPELAGCANAKIKWAGELPRAERHSNHMLLLCGRKTIVRTSLTKYLTYKREHLRREYNVLSALKETGISPGAYLFFKGDKNLDPFVLLEFIRGRQPSRLTSALLKKVAHRMAEMHSVPIARLRRNLRVISVKMRILRASGKKMIYLNKMRNLIGEETLRLINNEFLRQRRSEFHGEKFCLVHGDLCMENIVASGGQIRFIDFENSSISEPEWDIATFFYREKLSPVQKSAFLREYLENCKFDLNIGRVRRFENVKILERLLWAIREAFAIKDGRRGKEFLRDRNELTYLSYAKEIFDYGKDVGLFPKTAMLKVNLP